MRHITDAGIALIKRFESFSPTIYVCPAGYPTVGYGHVVLDGESDHFAGGIDENEAEDLLRRDAGIAERAVLRLISVPLTDGQFDALVSFTFNVGAGGLQRSTLRGKVNREEHGLVPTEFVKWVWAGGRKLAGLERRREAEARCYIGSPATGRASAAQGRQLAGQESRPTHPTARADHGAVQVAARWVQRFLYTHDHVATVFTGR